ncbi:helix-turn-helix domain-containing protein [Thermomonospora cellulosilytica]|uniref:Transcriptional regulator with XRE-family HTH domain n=1 Tax=Thermomonospora cellulosilytica TaxID=1411118 RepID=A0A7W3MU78_9ACTN|nr:helix-turn-helix transcriptional regulator [Thermomonospora cellulosilytica]MBA9001944.1 transcriptional regulator with XRE-family HTH domain [Thermomonospora cellulosilytica]
MSADKKAIGARLRAEREATPYWSRAEMARRLRAAADPRELPDIPHVQGLASMIKEWERGDHIPSGRYRRLYARALKVAEEDLFAVSSKAPQQSSTEAAPRHEPAADVVDLASWLQQTNIGDDTLDYLRSSTRRLAIDYVRRPPLDVIDDAVMLQRQVTALLRDGRQRLGQTRHLLAISAELFALLNLLQGDVGRYALADVYGYAAWTCAQEADSDAARALVLCAQTKTARWEERYEDAAALARRGFELAPPGEPKVLLAASQAAALQLQGDIDAARRALMDTERARDEVDSQRPVADAWSCTRARQATYALQVGLGARDPRAVLRDVRTADDAWAEGDPWVYGTWAQVRIGAALAHVMNGEPEAAATELQPVFDLSPEYRVVTIVGRMTEVGRRLGHSRYKGDPHAAALRERIAVFQAGSLESAASPPEVP